VETPTSSAEKTVAGDPTGAAPAGGGEWPWSSPVAPRAAYALAFLSGFLYFLGFAGTDIWPLSLLALAPMAVALEGQTPKRALVVGAIAGFTMNTCGFYWLLGMLKTFSGFPTALCLVFMSILCAYQGGRIAWFGWLYGRATTRGWPKTLVFCLAFAASELTYPLLFPWYFSASVHQVPALTQLAELGGPYLVGLVLAAPSLAIAEIALARLHRRPMSRRLVVGGLAVPALAAMFGYVRLRQIDARALASEPLHVGLVQADQPLIATRDSRAESLREHVGMTEDLRAKGADLVVWSEAALLMNVPEEDYGGYLQRILTRRLHVPTIIGTVLTRHQRPRSIAFNTALAADASGRITSRYDKHYLLAFGEYLPLGDTFPVLYDLSPNSGNLHPGDSVAPLTIGDHRFTTLICYEDILPSFVNAAVREGNPDLLVNMTNDAWFGDTTEPWIHLALAQMRAVEHRRYLVRATNSGVSAIIDPVGRVIAHGGTFRAETVDGIVHMMRGKTGYEIWGDAPWWLATFAVLGMAFVPRRRRRA
jgi:apolipoprotein N-acyltransferase